MKKVLSLLILISILFLHDNIIFAGELTIDAHVDGFTTGDSWQINSAGAQLTSKENTISIEDLTVTNSGWIFTISFVDFTATGIDDPSVAPETLSIKVDVEDWLSMMLKDSTDAPIISDDIPATTGLDIAAPIIL